MVVVGAIAVVANLRPVAYLQAIVVFSSTSAAATFVVPALMMAFWRRATTAGALAAMLAGSATMLGLFAAGWILSWRGYDPMIGPATRFRPYYLLGLEPIVWGLAASLARGRGRQPRSRLRRRAELGGPPVRGYTRSQAQPGPNP